MTDDPNDNDDEDDELVPPPRPLPNPSGSSGDPLPPTGHPDFQIKRRRPPRPRLGKHDLEHLVFPVIDRKMWGFTVPEIIRQIHGLCGLTLGRNNVYDILDYAFANKKLIAVPDTMNVLAAEMSRVPNQGDIQVVSTFGRLVADPVAEAGALLVQSLIRQVAYAKQLANPELEPTEIEVHVALGIGPSTGRLVEILARLVAGDLKAPRIVVHALTTNHSIYDIAQTPPFFFFEFRRNGLRNAQFVPIDYEPFVQAERYPEVMRSPAVREAYNRRHDCDIVLTSIARSRDPHGHYRLYLDRYGDEGAVDELLGRGWVGDVHLRPYDTEGPMEIATGPKPITLFEIEDLVRLAHTENKHVVLLCSPCGQPDCKTLKSEALLPLLFSEPLHVWNHLLIDEDTAKEVLGKIGTAIPA